MKISRIFTLFLAMLFLPALVFAQKTIKGIINDEQNRALPFAVVSLRNATDSSIVSAEYADSLGAFSIKLPEEMKMGFIEAQLFGYEIKNTKIPETNNDTIFLLIQLKPSEQQLKVVEVTKARPLIERKVDRTVFNVENSIAALGSDAFELLKKAPGVQVSNNVVSIAGKSTVSVMINDRLTQVSGSELESMLRSMAGSNISRIEVITTPPAKYDAEGNAGIINIITKKQNKDGFNGNATLSYEQRTAASQNFQSSFNYRKQKLNVYGNANANKYRFITLQQTNTQYPNQKQEQVLDQNNRPLYSWTQVGADYAINKKSILGILYTHGTMDTKRDEYIQTDMLQVPSLKRDSIMLTDAFAKDKGERNVLNLNYDWKLDTSGKKISFNLDYFNRKGSNIRDFTTGNFDANGDPTLAKSNNNTYGKSLTEISAARVDVELPGKTIQYTFGAKVSSIHNNNNNVFEYLAGTNYVTDATKTNSFDYRENTQAAYFSASKSWNKWEAQFGLRAEYTQTRGQSLTLNQTNTNDYFKIFPTAYVQFELSENHSFNLNYSRRINRPSFWNMNPFRVYSTATAYEQGNPFLQPSFSHNVELGYKYKSGFSVNAYVGKVDAYATRVSQIDVVNNSFYFTQANAGNELRYGINTSFNFLPFPWWESSTEVSAGYIVFQSDFYNSEHVHYKKPAFSFETSNTFNLNKKNSWVAELNLNYEGRCQEDFDVQSQYYNLGIGLKHLMLHKNLIVAVNMDDIFRSDIWIVNNQYNGTYQYAYFDNRCLTISLTWKFGNQAIKGKRDRNSSSDEVKRAN